MTTWQTQLTSLFYLWNNRRKTDVFSYLHINFRQILYHCHILLVLILLLPLLDAINNTFGILIIKIDHWQDFDHNPSIAKMTKRLRKVNIKRKRNRTNAPSLEDSILKETFRKNDKCQLREEDWKIVKNHSQRIICHYIESTPTLQ